MHLMGITWMRCTWRLPWCSQIWSLAWGFTTGGLAVGEIERFIEIISVIRNDFKFLRFLHGKQEINNYTM